ncbi:MAG: D-alanyl-D-alanine carboxypeptidase/D-alanyl-D-alanine-endopeptidase, partial [Deltaproteobacteria bacterium]|nr:D-alanyl-D-alanine carboxypeptidase/D-alanyl-D-alanine-endopeptidase [Deltaproteobacteria bacterium]
ITRKTGFGASSLRMPGAVLLLAALLALLLPAPPQAHAAKTTGGKPQKGISDKALKKHIETLLIREDLKGYQLGLALYSTAGKRYLYQHDINQTYIAASNIKLVTTYAALKSLSPEYRWRTRVYLVEEKDPSGGKTRLGLLVKGVGDPTIRVADFEKLAAVLLSMGIHRLDGSLYLDDRLYDGTTRPDSWKANGGSQRWFAPVSPFVVEQNLIEFIISSRDAKVFNVKTISGSFQVDSRFKIEPQSSPLVHVTQDWSGGTARFHLRGTMPEELEPYFIEAAVNDPIVYFHVLLRERLNRQGIEGPLPLVRSAAPGLSKEYIHTISSRPLSEVIRHVNKDSSNLAAESLLMAMGRLEKDSGVSAADGLGVVARVVESDFSKLSGQLNMADGSGLSRQGMISPRLLVNILNHVSRDFSLQAEYINSLSLAGVDGTLQYRNFPYWMRGKLRAKSGTLDGVGNISGYMELPGDVVIFSFLINGSDRSFLELQESQDRVLTGIFEALAGRASPKTAGAGGPQEAGRKNSGRGQDISSN